jgi:hypothetical protein
MSDAAPTQAQTSQPELKDAKLEDLMVAMDVVDTLRHQQSTIDRELDTEGRRERLLERLRDIYSAQGLDVPDHILQEGILALEEDRFAYKQRTPSFSTKLAHWYVNRGKLKNPFKFLIAAGGLFGGVHFFNDVLPERELRSQLPAQIQALSSEAGIVSKSESALEQVKEKVRLAELALQNDELEKADELRIQAKALVSQLRQKYQIRIISKPGESSGIWRVPDANPNAKNYYLIVQAIDSNGDVVKVKLKNEESNKVSIVSKWGVRVDESTFYKVARDKKDDGIIQGSLVGEKLSGYLEPSYTINTTGSAITSW